MANYFIAQTAAGLGDGSSPENAIALASVTWGGRVNDDNYLIGTITSMVNLTANGNSDNDRMRIYGDWPGYECTITNAAGHGINLSANFISLRGIEITGCSLSGVRFANGANRQGYDMTRVNSHNNGQKGLNWTQTVAFGLDDVTVTDCNFDDNDEAGIFMNTTSTNVASALSNLTFTRVTSLRNGDNAAKIGNAAITTKNHSNIKIIDCNWSACTGQDGGTAINGFTATKHWDNYITDSTFNDNYGLNGGLNLLYCDYFHVYENIASGNKAYTDATETTVTIDGNGILIDNGCTEIECYNNECSNNPGNTTHDNSGGGIMVLGATQTRVYGNYGTGNRSGINFGGATHTDTQICSNRFDGCLEFGVYVGNAVADNVVDWKSNVFTAAGVGTGFYRETGTDQTSETNNTFYNFAADTNNHTLGTGSNTTDPGTVSDDNKISETASVINTGEKWWSGANPISYSQQPFSDIDTTRGHIQMSYSTAHVKNR